MLLELFETLDHSVVAFYIQESTQFGVILEIEDAIGIKVGLDLKAAWKVFRGYWNILYIDWYVTIQARLIV
jgi:hypothetical protein